MEKKRVVICDDQQRFLDLFYERHKSYYDITRVLDSRKLMDAIEDNGLPDVVLLDLYFPHNDDDESSRKASIAEEQLRLLDNQILSTKSAVLDAWEPRGIELLGLIRDKYTASVLPVIIFTQKGLFLLDDNQIRKVEENNGHWLLKGQLSAQTEEVRIDRIMKYDAPTSKHGCIKHGSIFIGHGQNPYWRELKDYIEDELRLSVETYGKENPAGMYIPEYVFNMVKKSSFAFLVMTTDNKYADGSMHARENVIHEIGLCQAQLGPRRAIILLEEGCKDFSNMSGLHQFRFPLNNISSVFHEVRSVLERENILPK